MSARGPRSLIIGGTPARDESDPQSQYRAFVSNKSASSECVGRSRVMKKYPQLALSLSALIAYGAVVCAGYFYARAQAANEACGVDCLMQRVDALSEKTAALEHTVEQLTAEVGKSILCTRKRARAAAAGPSLVQAGIEAGMYLGMRIALTAPCGRSISEYGPKCRSYFRSHRPMTAPGRDLFPRTSHQTLMKT